jgi:actin cytoskeleton-regulatory complex protein SLA1
MATQDPDMYLAILKASYDYEPQSEDEITIQENQLLLLIERVDEELVIL